MPNIKSAIKRVKVTQTKNLRNRMIKTSVKSAIKRLDTAVAAGNAADIAAQLSSTSSAIDKAASKGVIHKNTANRKKARLARQVAKTAQ